MMGKILIAEDDEMIVRFLVRRLRAEGFAVEAVHDGVSAAQSSTAETSLLLLDLNLPQMNGIDVLSRVRSSYPRLPVLVLTASSGAAHVVRALEAGADDYLQKPFAFAELLARIRALLRRNTTAAQDRSCCGDLVFDRDRRCVTRAGQRVELSPREYSLLACLMRTPGVPIARATLLEEVWGSGTEPSTNVVDVYMKYLRDKIDLPGLPKLIRTVRGTGYVVSEV